MLNHVRMSIPNRLRSKLSLSKSRPIATGRGALNASQGGDGGQFPSSLNEEEGDEPQRIIDTTET